MFGTHTNILLGVEFFFLPMREVSVMADRFTVVVVACLTAFFGLAILLLIIYEPQPMPASATRLFDALIVLLTTGGMNIFGLLNSRSRNPPTKR
jgi:hypothetical protein